MTGLPWLDWAMLAVSLFNALLLLWLGLTVFLNAERRVWGIWLASAGLLLGAAFFIIHTVILAILGSGISLLTSVRDTGLDTGWRLGWLPVAALPFMWYLAVLWYAGYWERRQAEGRQRYGLALLSLGGLALTGLLYAASTLYAASIAAFTNPTPSMSELANAPAGVPAGIPAVVLAYTLYNIACLGLSIDALRHPFSSARLMGEVARLRARRWLIATSLVLLAVSLLVGWALIWIAASLAASAANSARQDIFSPRWMITVSWFDLLIAGLIAVSMLLLGQAVVAYEVFTGQTLPRRGLAQSWRRAVILAAAFSGLASAGLALELHPVYPLLLSAVMMVAFLALLGWRAFAERQRLIENLRPFAASPGIIDNLLKEGAPQAGGDEAEMEAPGKAASYEAPPFQALCANLLETRRAGLFPYGPLALLAGAPSFYPPASPFSPPDLDQLAARLLAARAIGLSLEPAGTGDLVFAVPLWREAGLSGVILLGAKLSGAPYTQEEIEIAQATGERLIDAQASAEMARRLVGLQRQRLAAGQVADRRARRALHDETLPLVHAAMLHLAGGDASQSKNEEALELLQETHRQLTSLLRSMPATTLPGVEGEGLIGALRRTVSDELEGAFDEVEWQIDPGAEALGKALPPLVAEVVYAAAREGIRNAARHGRGDNEQYRLRLEVSAKTGEQGKLQLTVQDNGVGLEAGYAPKALAAGEPARTGSGQGLALHSTLMAVIGGSLTLSSQPGRTRLRLELPRGAWEIP
jgi:signal transduction histidine kinase